MRTPQEIKDKLAKIEADERFSYPPADIQINAPLALIQVAMQAQHEVLTWCLETPEPTSFVDDKGLYRFTEEDIADWQSRDRPPIILMVKNIRANTYLSLRDAKALFDKSRHLLPPHRSTVNKERTRDV